MAQPTQPPVQVQVAPVVQPQPQVMVVQGPQVQQQPVAMSAPTHEQQVPKPPFQYVQQSNGSVAYTAQPQSGVPQVVMVSVCVCEYCMHMFVFICIFISLCIVSL